MKKNPFHNVIYLRNNKFKEIYTKPLFIETVPYRPKALKFLIDSLQLGVSI